MSKLLGTLAAATLFLIGPAGAADERGAKALGPSETISGKIVSVDTHQKLVIVKDAAGGVILDMRVMPSTRIRFGTRAVLLKDLTAGTNVDVRFVPERSGDMARLVEITG